MSLNYKESCKNAQTKDQTSKDKYGIFTKDYIELLNEAEWRLRRSFHKP